MREVPIRAETRRERIRVLANADWNALAHEVSPTEHARRHLASLSRERRAELHAEWSALRVERVLREESHG